MKNNASLDNTIRPVLLVLGLLFLSALIFESMLDHELDEQVPLQTGPGIAEKPLEPQTHSLAPLTDYTEVIERPLFMEDRRPFVAPETVAKVAPTTRKAPAARQRNENFSLSAIIITDEKRLALIQSGRNKKLQKVAQGEQLDGWTLNDIQPGRITLTRGSETKQLELAVKSSPQQPKSTPSPQARSEQVTITDKPATEQEIPDKPINQPGS